MGNAKRPAGTFVSPYKLYLIKKEETYNSYIIFVRSGDSQIGSIIKEADVWRFYPQSNIERFEHLEMLDIAAVIKLVEKRENNPNLYQK